MNKIELLPATLDNVYIKKWNIRSKDFYNIYVNGMKLSDTLYRIGGFAVNISERYFMLLKHVESFYDDTITKKFKDKPHLESQWCIIDSANGNEIVNFNHSLDTPYLHGGVIYSLNNHYFNIENGYSYCKRNYKSITSDNFIFLENKFDDDISKRGVSQIKKIDGSFELIQ